MTQDDQRVPVPLAPGVIEPGVVLGERYKIIRKIGQGGMGTVFEAQELEEDLDRSVAIKVLPPDLMRQDPTLARRFRAEIRIASRLEHPNIIPIYNVGQHGETPYFVMKYIRGRTLNAILRGGDGLDPDEMLSIAVQIGRALNHIHQSGAIHRDIKSSNIMVDDAGHATLMDFGISKSTDSTFVTASGEIMGTGPYVAPEQWDGRSDARTDIWAFGVVLFELATGRLPFVSKSIVELMNLIVNKPVPSLRKERRDLSDTYLQTVERCLEKSPDRRFQTMIEVLMSLEGKGPVAAAPLSESRDAAPEPAESRGDVTRALGEWERARAAARGGESVDRLYEQYTQLAETEEQAVVQVRERIAQGDLDGARALVDAFLQEHRSRRVEELKGDLRQYEAGAAALLAKARERAAAEDPRAAEKLYRQVLTRDPNNATARRELDTLLRKKRPRHPAGRGFGDFAFTWGLRGAIALVVLAIFLPKISPKAGSAMLETMGDATLKIGLVASPPYVNAYALYERALKYRADGADREPLLRKQDEVVATFVQKGNAAMEQGFSQLAADAYQDALALRPDDPAAKKGLEKARAIAEAP